ncbi:MAG: hypothetical protein PHT69_16805 [Bacteroidales bacterium]|nr:hypothetical protein [Bacteroidales bacterium]
MKKLIITGIIISCILFSLTSVAQNNRGNRENRQNAGTVTNQETPAVVMPVQIPDTTAPTPQTEQSNPTLEQRNPPTPQRAVGSSSRNPSNINLQNIVNNSRPVVTPVSNGNLNWTEQFIEATGSTLIDSERFANPAHAKAMATRGAVVVAQRNLLEIINGVQVTSETTVRDMMTVGDIIYTRVDGVIKGAEMVGEPVEKEGMMEVRMRVPMYKTNGLAGALYEHLPINPAPETRLQPSTEVQNQSLDGLAFNLNGQQYDPALFPVIVDENNNIVLDMAKLYNPNTGSFPQILNSAETIFRELGIREGVEVVDVLRTEPGKIVLNNTNARKINWNKIINTAKTIGELLMFFI